MFGPVMGKILVSGGVSPDSFVSVLGGVAARLGGVSPVGVAVGDGGAVFMHVHVAVGVGVGVDFMQVHVGVGVGVGVDFMQVHCGVGVAVVVGVVPGSDSTEFAALAALAAAGTCDGAASAVPAPASANAPAMSATTTEAIVNRMGPHPSSPPFFPAALSRCGTRSGVSQVQCVTLTPRQGLGPRITRNCRPNFARP